MWRNYLKTGLRNLIKYKGYSLTNMLGLAIGLSVCLLIGLFVWDEQQFDRDHPDGDLIYRAYNQRFTDEGAMFSASGSPQVGPVMKADFPEVEENLRLFQIRQKLLFKKDDKSFLEEKGFYAEAAVFHFFRLPFLYGDPASALSSPNGIVLTEPIAVKYFGGENPVGKSLTINNQELQVTGVLATLSPHFHLDFNFLLPFSELEKQVSKERIQSWVWQDFYTYIKVRPGTDVERLKAKLPGFVEKYAHPQTKEMGFYYYTYLQPVKDIHLQSAGFQNDVAIKGNQRYVNGLSVIGIFLLLIACINFVNLTTAKAVRRAKEVGVRKATGALRGQLILQFISESVILSTVATAAAVIVTLVFLPYLNSFTDKAMEFPVMKNPVILVGLALLTGILAGIYPAVVLSGFRPIHALKAGIQQGGGHIQWMRKGLVVLQFGLSILMIIGTLAVYRQVEYLNNKDMGFQREQLLIFPMRTKMFDNPENTRAEFANTPGVQSASVCFGIPGDIVSGDEIMVPGEEPKRLPARIFTVDHDYIKTMGMELAAGRDFSKEIRTDAGEAFILNETAVRAYGLGNTPEEAIGKPLEWKMWTDQDTVKKGRVIGVVRDFHYASLHEEVEATVLHIYPDAYWKVALRLDGNNVASTLEAVQATWDRFATGYPIDYQFVDASFGEMYKAEEKLSSLFGIFTLLAILIACIGAFGLIAHAAEQRVKEIGIRKVLGATAGHIVVLLSRDFLLLVLASLILAVPIAWYFLKGWLDEFPYRIDLDIWIFLLAGGGALLIAGLTVGFQALKAAVANPVRSLKSE